MTEAREPEPGGHSGAPDAVIAEPPPAAPEPEAPPHRAASSGLWLGIVLAVVVLAVVAAPFWAPAVVPLLPWGGTGDEHYAGVTARLDAIERRLAAGSSDEGTRSALAALGRRVDQLDAARAKELPAADQQRLADRVAALEKQSAARAEDAKAAQQLEQRIAALEKELAARPAIDPTAVARNTNALAALSDRLVAAERQLGTLARESRGGAALALALLQIEEAVQSGRPFPEEYATLQSLARDRPEVLSAATPLAEAAQNGVATRTVLARELHARAGRIATTAPPPAEDDWGGQVLARLYGLVTIRRIDGPGRSAPEAAVADAETRMAEGDLAGAVAALGKLPAPNAEAARPWLTMAEARLRVDGALQKLQDLIVAGLGGAPGNGKPPAGPGRTPS